MEINVINAAARLSLPSQPPADARHIAKFSQLMQPVEPATPMVSPDQFLSVQSAWMQTTLAVDLTAKVAGVVGQNINKLVNMQ